MTLLWMRCALVACSLAPLGSECGAAPQPVRVIVALDGIADIETRETAEAMPSWVPVFHVGSDRQLVPGQMMAWPDTPAAAAVAHCVVGVRTSATGEFKAVWGDVLVACFDGSPLPGSITPVPNRGRVWVGKSPASGDWERFSATSCLPDVTGVGGAPTPPDGDVSVDDIVAFVSAFADAAGLPRTVPCNLADVTDIGGPPLPPDGELTVDDVIAFFNAYGDGC